MTTHERRPALPRGGLYAITPDEDGPLSAQCGAVALAIRGGAKIIQYRRKHMPFVKSLAAASALREICTSQAALFIVNDDVDLALASGADGVHLGRLDGDWATLAKDSRRTLLLGLSCYGSLARAREAETAGVDYVAFGSFFPSPTKPDATHCPIKVLIEARHELRLPIVAIGGITPENGDQLLSAGADFLAVISGIFAQDDVALAAARFAKLFEVTSHV